MRIADLPVDDRPREKLWQHGVELLSDAELIAIVLRNGHFAESVTALAQRLLATFHGLCGLGTTSREQFMELRGMGPVKTGVMLAIIEFARRWQQAPLHRPLPIASSEALYQRYRTQLRGRRREQLLVISLDAKNCPLAADWVARGDTTNALLRPKDIFLRALMTDATAIAILHNHPSGDPTPSTADAETTRQLAMLGWGLGIPLLDHLIIGDETYYSFRDTGHLRDMG
ncbi:MAG: DNA repair protein RadC [Deltaproteobacteria bacterium]|nr:DNA repair protein RadC [Deltaproteobacteria bacterium]